MTEWDSWISRRWLVQIARAYSRQVVLPLLFVTMPGSQASGQTSSPSYASFNGPSQNFGSITINTTTKNPVKNNITVGTHVLFGSSYELGHLWLMDQGLPSTDFTFDTTTETGSRGTTDPLSLLNVAWKSPSDTKITYSLEVNFTPTAPGLRTATVWMFDNDYNLSGVLTFYGMGLALPITPNLLRAG